MIQPSLVKVKCKRCGKCCLVYLHGHFEDCHYLIRFKKTTRCRIYSSRIGKKVGKTEICMYRKDVNFDYPDCSYNTGKPIHPQYLLRPI